MGRIKFYGAWKLVVKTDSKMFDKAKTTGRVYGPCNVIRSVKDRREPDWEIDWKNLYGHNIWIVNTYTDHELPSWKCPTFRKIRITGRLLGAPFTSCENCL